MTVKHKKRATSYFEYCYRAAPESDDAKTLIVSFPGRKGNRQNHIPPDKSPAFLWDVLNGSNADVLFIRSVYEGDYNEANVTNDCDLLPEFLHDIREQHGIKRLVLFGFSLGCELCVRLAREYVADELVLLSPAIQSVTTLNAIENNQWQQDFEKFCSTWCLPQIEPYPQKMKVKIIQGLHLEEHLLKERPLVYYLKLLMPQATVETVSGAGHHIPNFWKDQKILQTKIHDLLGIKATALARNYPAEWSKVTDVFTYNALAHGAQSPNMRDNRVTAA
jgi:pimeloyl-ACP methyl ester carboxylesterase